jgi:hypothetical protein
VTSKGNLRAVLETLMACFPSITPVAKVAKTKFVRYEFAVPILANQSFSKFWFEFSDANSSTPVI